MTLKRSGITFFNNPLVYDVQEVFDYESGWAVTQEDYSFDTALFLNPDFFDDLNEVDGWD